MEPLFPYANYIIGTLVFVIGFLLHGIAQGIYLVNPDLAKRIGLAEPGLLPEYEIYERGIAVADLILSPIYLLATIGLFYDLSFGYKLLWFPGVIFIYHGCSFWFWTKNRRQAGYPLYTDSLRIGWTLTNLIAGILAILIAWNRF